ncbi:CRAL-TRIO domain-containing protein [Naematelia encephala]|uniref:CRAL-TRIO domain-containing protein n=1 Tax=Naematelia encephala TaxID=71784 RepID=A0A1Y2BBN5_9TREE|nr:CRAL-TRIO domain-containing protein [Naematelia encephala]
MAGTWASLLIPPVGCMFPPAVEPTTDQQAKIKLIEETFGADGFVLPVSEGGSEKVALSEREMMFLSKETFIRFLAATKGDTAETIKRLEAALIWRRSVSIEDVEAMAADCEPESRTGKNLVLGYSPHGQPVVYFFPNRNTTPVEQRRAIHAIFMLERARDLMVDGVTNVVAIFNFSGQRQSQPTSISVARTVIHILSAHYPENLSLGIFQALPWLVRSFINLMWPLVDSATKKKVRFDNNQARDIVVAGELDQALLLKECGGDLDMPYEHEEYWKALVETCLERRKIQDELFKAGEKKVGRSEREWKKRDTSEKINSRIV